MTPRKLAMLTVAGYLMFAGTPTASAQIGGLIRKKVGEAVKAPDKGKEKAKDPDGTKGPVFTERVVELTVPVVKNLMKGIDGEVAQLTEFDKLLGTYKTQDQYEACTQQAAMTPDAQKILTQLTDLPEKTTAEQVQRVTEKMGKDMNALIDKKCGVSLVNDWPDNKRRDRVDEIHANAAATAGLLLRSNSGGQFGAAATHDVPAVGIAQESAATEANDQGAADAAGMLLPRTPAWDRGESAIGDAAVESTQQKGSTEPLDIAEERIDAYCKYKKVAAPGMFPLPPGYNLSFAASKLDPKGSTSMYYTYTAAEVAAIDPQCTPITLTVGKIIILMDEIKIRGRRK